MSDFNPFDQMTFTNDRCFLCGELLTDVNRSKEHVYPKWLQNKFNLWNASLILLNNTPIRYKDLTIPCCKRCNGIMSNKIEKSVLAIDYCKDENTLIYCASMSIDKDSKPLKINTSCGEKKHLSWQEALMESLTIGAYGGCNFLIPKKAFDKCGGFNESLRYIQDTVMWEKFFLNGFSLLKIPEVCVKYRIHGEQQTQIGQAIFRQEAKYISCELLPQLLKVSTKKMNFLKPYAINTARDNNKEVVRDIIRTAKENKLFSFLDKVEIFAMGCYGRVRPFIRRTYYRLFRNIKTS